MPSLSISSSMNTGFFDSARRSPWMICPGKAPMYVRRWPRISASSRMPPSEMRWNARPSARAMERPSEVLPTPGGPTKQRIGSLPAGRIDFTARYSRMRSLTFSSPQWSSSRIARAAARSSRSVVSLLHGSAMSQSRYVRATVYSAAAGGILPSRSSSRSASFLASSVICAASIFSRSSSSSRVRSSVSPSSFWMAFNCSRR